MVGRIKAQGYRLTYVDGWNATFMYQYKWPEL
jgi:hypothetical protein